MICLSELLKSQLKQRMPSISFMKYNIPFSELTLENLNALRKKSADYINDLKKNRNKYLVYSDEEVKNILDTESEFYNQLNLEINDRLKYINKKV